VRIYGSALCAYAALVRCFAAPALVQVLKDGGPGWDYGVRADPRYATVYGEVLDVALMLLGMGTVSAHRRPTCFIPNPFYSDRRCYLVGVPWL